MPRSPGSGRSYTVEQNDRIRGAALRLMAENYDGVRAALGTAVGMTPAAISLFLNGTNGAGRQLVEGLAKLLGVSEYELVHGVPEPRGDEDPALGQAPEYAAREDEARKLTRLPQWVWGKLRRVRGLVVPSPLTTEFVVQQALNLWNYVPDEQKSEIVRAEVEAQIKRHVATAENRERRTRDESKKRGT